MNKTCTEKHRVQRITTDHRMVNEYDGVFGAVVCPHCDHRIPLNGNPIEFRLTVSRCFMCRRIILINLNETGEIEKAPHTKFLEEL